MKQIATHPVQNWVLQTCLENLRTKEQAKRAIKELEPLVKTLLGKLFICECSTFSEQQKNGVVTKLISAAKKYHTKEADITKVKIWHPEY